MMTAVKLTNPKPDRLRLPSLLLEHIATDLNSAAKGIINPGGIYGFNIGNRESVLWIWDLQGFPKFEHGHFMNDMTADAALKKIAHLCGKMPLGVLILTKDVVLSGPQPGIMARVREWRESAIESMPADRDVRGIIVKGKRLAGMLKEITGIDWNPEQVMSCGLIGFNNDHANLLSLSHIAHATKSVVINIPKNAEFTQSEHPLWYHRAKGYGALPTPDILHTLAYIDGIAQESIVFGDKPRTHLLFIGSPAENKPSSIAAWRNIGDAEETGENLQVLAGQINWLKRKGRFNQRMWETIFRIGVIGQIIEPVPIEKMETDEKVTEIIV